MTELGLPAAVLVASLAATYFFCLRPMRRGHCAMSPRRSAGQGLEVQDRDAEVARLREEIAALRAEPGARPLR